MTDWSTCDLSDAHGAAARVVPPGLRHFGGRTRFSGAAVTIRCHEDNSRLRELVGMPGDGRVLVVDAGGSTRCALLGDTLAGTALEHGWAGVVLDGCVRDVVALSALDLGVMARASSPRRSGKHGDGQVEVAVEIVGIRCAPGDLVFADEDGVVILDPATTP